MYGKQKGLFKNIIFFRIVSGIDTCLSLQGQCAGIKIVAIVGGIFFSEFF